MIQRIQSVFFLLAAGSFGALFALPIASSPAPATPFLEDLVFNVFDQPLLAAIAGIGAALALATIFLFRNRTLQVRLGFVVVALAFLLVGISYLQYTNLASAQSAGNGLTLGPGLFIPGGAMIFGYLATYFVRKDEKVVRSMDRLR
jgi:hypothetical protein